MGKKINPLGFRLGTTQSHHSLWFAQQRNYSEGLQENQKFRNFVKKYVQKNIPLSFAAEGIARIEIKKGIEEIEVILFMGFPKLLTENRPQGVEEFKRNFQNEFHYITRKLKLSIKGISKPYGNPNIIAEFIAEQLKNRVSFRKVIKQAIELSEEADTKGIQVQIAGRIDGKEIARVE